MKGFVPTITLLVFWIEFVLGEEGTRHTTKSNDFDSIIAVATSAISGALEGGIRSEGHPLHDAVIASGYMSLPAILSLSEIITVLQCTYTKDETDAFIDAIPRMLRKAVEKGKVFGGGGRIIEFSDQSFSISDNYRANLQAATVACVVLEPTHVNRTHEIGPGAYASQLLTRSMFDIMPMETSAHAHNLSMLLEADVLELPVSGAYYIPKRYCFDFDDMAELGLYDSTLENTDPGWSNQELIRPLSLGTKESTLRSTFNRVTWSNELQFDLSLTTFDALLKIVREAFEDPKIELLALIEAQRSHSCDEHYGFEYDTGPSLCLINEAVKIANSWGVVVEDLAFLHAIRQLQIMWNVLGDWTNEKKKIFRYPEEIVAAIEENVNPEDFPGLEDIFKMDFDRQIFAIFPAPPFFEKNFASWGRMSLIPSQMTNPYHQQADFDLKIKLPLDKMDEDIHACVHGDGGISTSGASTMSLNLRRALRRRMNEFVGKPLEQVSAWAVYNEDTFGFDDIGVPIGEVVGELVRQYQQANEKYLNQNVTWNIFHELQSGNLTEKQLGRTAKWLLVSDWFDSNPLQTLLETARESRIYSNTATDAIDIENPCAKAASDADIFLFVLGMVTAACGGVNAILWSLHYAFHWWAIFWSCPDGPQEGQRSITNGWRKFLPTYELWLIMIGTGAFFGLYAPLMLQIISEYEVANFATSAPGLEAFYANDAFELLDSGYPVLVSMVYVDTTCEEARPELLVTLLVIGFSLGVVINAPYIHRASRGWLRYWRRLRSANSVEPEPNSTVHDSELSLLLPTTGDDDIRRDRGSLRMIHHLNVCRFFRSCRQNTLRRSASSDNAGNPSNNKSVVNEAVGNADEYPQQEQILHSDGQKGLPHKTEAGATAATPVTDSPSCLTNIQDPICSHGKKVSSEEV